jgi:hypothetical protein
MYDFHFKPELRRRLPSSLESILINFVNITPISAVASLLSFTTHTKTISITSRRGNSHKNVIAYIFRLIGNKILA